MSESTTLERTRTVTWGDPLISARVAPKMSGMEYLQAIGRGDLPVPPIMTLLNIGFEDAVPGRVVFSVEPAEYHYNPIGMVHGGLASTLCDSAMGCAIHSSLPLGVGYTTREMKGNFVRPLNL